MKKTTLIVVITGLSFCLNACKTYYIPTGSFKQQFSGMDSSVMKEVTTRGPAGDKVKYKTYPLDFIKCMDEKGQQVELKVSPSLEIRFTDTNNKKTIFYFDRIFVNDTSIEGVQSRFIASIRKKIPLNSVKKIEVQDGRKNFRYVN